MILERVWVSGLDNIIFISIVGEILYYLDDICRYGNGFYILNSENELFYINENYDIKKKLWDLSMIIIFFKKKKYLIWIFWCVYCLLLIGDLLVGMIKVRLLEGIVIRFN